MKLATLKDGTRDGRLVIVSRDLARCVAVPEIARTLQAALDAWDGAAPALDALSAELNAGRLADAEPFDPRAAMAPLPRAYQWADGSAYVNHVELVRRARGATMPPEFWTDPLMYQGGSDSLLGAHDDVVVADEAWGIDFEAEVAVVTGDVPMGVAPAEAARGIRLLMLVNDVSLRNLIPAELGKGFGFLQSKPASAFSPVAVTPDELGASWRDGRVHLPLVSTLNGKLFGRPNAGRRHDVRLPAADRPSGPHPRARGRQHRRIGNRVQQGRRWAGPAGRAGRRGLLLHRRAAHGGDDPHGHAVTPFMRFGDRIRIEMDDAAGRTVFGAIDQAVRAPAG